MRGRVKRGRVLRRESIEGESVEGESIEASPFFNQQKLNKIYFLKAKLTLDFCDVWAQGLVLSSGVQYCTMLFVRSPGAAFLRF